MTISFIEDVQAPFASKKGVLPHASRSISLSKTWMIMKGFGDRRRLSDESEQPETVW
jgi:hypothetical protein